MAFAAETLLAETLLEEVLLPYYDHHAMVTHSKYVPIEIFQCMNCNHHIGIRTRRCHLTITESVITDEQTEPALDYCRV